MNQKVTNKYLSGTAIIAVPQEEIETILKHNFHCFKDVAKPREETHVFMHRFFEYLKKKKQITRSSKICLIIYIPQKRNFSKEEYSELNDFFCSWIHNFELSWGIYETGNLNKMEITIFTNVRRQKMKDYQSTNNQILEEMKQEMINRMVTDNMPESKLQEIRQQVEDSFCFDGIMFKGELHQNEMGDIVRISSKKDNILWANNLNKNVLFITKEPNLSGGCAWDQRCDSFRKRGSTIEHPMLIGHSLDKRIAYIIYGLKSVLDTPSKFIEFENIPNENILEAIDQYPFARINLKKTGGSDKANDKIVLAEAEVYKDYLKRQIENINPKIIICCSNSRNKNMILEEFLNSNGYNFEWTEVEGIWIDKSRNILAIDSYHLSYYGIYNKKENKRYDDKTFYNDVVKRLYEYLLRHPNFISKE